MASHYDGLIRMSLSRAARTLRMCAALALGTAGYDYCTAQSRLEADYAVTFANIQVGNITATAVFGDTDYLISAQARAGGIIKVLVEGEGVFTTGGTIKNGHPVATTFTSKITSKAATFDVQMVLDECSVKELKVEPPPPTSGIVPVSEAIRSRYPRSSNGHAVTDAFRRRPIASGLPSNFTDF